MHQVGMHECVFNFLLFFEIILFFVIASLFYIDFQIYESRHRKKLADLLFNRLMSQDKPKKSVKYINTAQRKKD